MGSRIESKQSEVAEGADGRETGFACFLSPSSSSSFPCFFFSQIENRQTLRNAPLNRKAESDEERWISLQIQPADKPITNFFYNKSNLPLPGSISISYFIFLSVLSNSSKFHPSSPSPPLTPPNPQFPLSHFISHFFSSYRVHPNPLPPPPSPHPRPGILKTPTPTPTRYQEA